MELEPLKVESGEPVEAKNRLFGNASKDYTSYLPRKFAHGKENLYLIPNQPHFKSASQGRIKGFVKWFELMRSEYPNLPV